MLNIYKPLGISPLQAIALFQQHNPIYGKIRLGYAGRLDPMAEGVLLVLEGEENLHRKEFEKLPKTYNFTALFGMETDTYDLLGKVIRQSDEANFRWDSDILQQYVGKKLQPYPPFSSPRVNGKPLFYWAREGRIAEIKIPQKEIEIYDIKQNGGLREVDKNVLKQLILERLSLVQGNFRQGEIVSGWEVFFDNVDRTAFFLGDFTISCSSGTYVRSIVQDLGQKCAVGATTFAIVRTQVGENTIQDSINVISH